MSYSIDFSNYFKRKSKKLAKKNPSLKEDLQQLVKLLEDEPLTGISLGKGIYKIRLNISSKNAGKRGGGRVFSFIEVDEEAVTLFAIIDKAENDTLSSSELEQLLKELD